MAVNTLQLAPRRGRVYFQPPSLESGLTQTPSDQWGRSEAEHSVKPRWQSSPRLNLLPISSPVWLWTRITCTLRPVCRHATNHQWILRPWLRSDTLLWMTAFLMLIQSFLLWWERNERDEARWSKGWELSQLIAVSYRLNSLSILYPLLRMTRDRAGQSPPILGFLSKFPAPTTR